MKTILFPKHLLLPLACMAVFASCKKDYTCDCVSTCTGASSTVTYTFTAKEKDAKEACDAYETTSGTCKPACELK